MSRVDNEKFYTAAIQKYGQSHRGVHWNSLHSQQTRFEVLLSFIREESFSLVDAGCGFGDLYTYLQERRGGCYRYVGLDTSPSMVKIAKENTGQQILECDICRDALPRADYFLCSGAMNILSRFDTYLFIRNCYEACEKGFVFNLLMGEDDSLVYNHFYPEELRPFFDELGAEVHVVKGYLPHDFSVFLKKEKS